MADTEISALSAVTSVTASDEFVLARSGANNKITASNLLLFDAYAYLRNEQAANTDGGAATTGSFQTCTINTEVFDPAGIVSLSANQFTLAAATYLVRARFPFFRTGPSRLKLRNVTDSTDVEFGNNAYSQEASSGEGECIADLFARFTLSGTKALSLMYQVGFSDSGNTGCLGKKSNFGVIEVYGEVEIWREA